MIALLLVGACAVLAALYVCGPLPRRDRSHAALGRDDLLGAESRKRAALGALLDIDEERELGKLGPEDFDHLRAIYEKEALEAIRELDDRAAADPDDELEREVAAMRANLTCAACGRLRSKDGRCPACGERS